MWRWDANDDLANCSWDFPDDTPPLVRTGLQQLFAHPNVWERATEASIGALVRNSNELPAFADRFDIVGRFA